MLQRFLNVFRPNRLEAEIREELEFHRAQSSGSFGNMTRIHEQTKAASSVVWLESLIQDLRYGFRQLRRTPVLSAAAILSLALGIGANTAIFSLVNAVLLRSLPVTHAEELSLIVKKDRLNNRGNFSFPFSRLLSGDTSSFSGVLITSQPGRSTIAVNAVDQTVTSESVSANYFAVLGLSPIAGRLFVKGEDLPGASDYAVISYGYWRRQFAMDPAAIGRVIERNGDPVTIIGVAPPEFFGISAGSSVDIWTTLSRVQPRFRNNPGMNFLQLLARRKPGVSEPAAQAEADALFQNHIREYTSGSGGWTQREKELVLSNRIVIEPGATGLSSLRLQYSKPLQLLLAITALVLLVACANIANLLLTRAAARRREIAMRLAIGASRGRIVRQLITESLMLAAFGGGLALLFAVGGARVLVTLMASGNRDRPLLLDYSLDWRVVLFSAAVTIVVGILFGIAPALRSIRDAGIHERAGIGEMGRAGFGRLLICFQVALTILLVAGSGLFLRTLVNLQSVPLGFDANQLYKADFGFTKGFADADKAALYIQLPDRLAAAPGVLSATLIWPWGGGWTNNVTIPSYSATETPGVYRSQIAPGFFATMGIPVQAGRDFTRYDAAGSTNVTIINQILARQYFSGRDPIGQFIQFPPDKAATQVVGVVGDSRVQGLRRDPPPMAYTPLAQTKESVMVATPAALLRLTGLPADLASAFKAIHPAIKFEGGILVKQQIEGQLVQERILALLSSFFGGLALLLAGIGLYGVLSYVLARRTTEIGVRMALGAQPRQVVSMVLRDLGKGVGLGLVVGIVAVPGLSRLVRQFLFGIQPNDPATILMAMVTLALVALVATLIPARRASRVDPMKALRGE